MSLSVAVRAEHNERIVDRFNLRPHFRKVSRWGILHSPRGVVVEIHQVPAGITTPLASTPTRGDVFLFVVGCAQ